MGGGYPILLYQIGMKGCQLSYLLGRCLPHALTSSLQHHCCHLFQGNSILSLDKFSDTQLLFVFYISIIDLIP